MQRVITTSGLAGYDVCVRSSVRAPPEVFFTRSRHYTFLGAQDIVFLPSYIHREILSPVAFADRLGSVRSTT